MVVSMRTSMIVGSLLRYARTFRKLYCMEARSHRYNRLCWESSLTRTYSSVSVTAKRKQSSTSKETCRVSSSSENNFQPVNAGKLEITEITLMGQVLPREVKKADLLSAHRIQVRDLRFSTASSLFVRGDNIILRLQNLKAIIKYNSVILLESNNDYVQSFIPELQKFLCREHDLPFEFVALEAMLMKKLSGLDKELADLEPALKNSLDRLLNPNQISIDKVEQYEFLRRSSTLSEFRSLVRDIEATLNEVLDAEDSMADMYLTHAANTHEERSPEDTEEVCNLLEAYACQVENMLSKIQTLHDFIEQSQSMILMNLDMQRNVMLRLSLQLEMGMFSAAMSGLIGMAFGMNLESSLEENVHLFWFLTGTMFFMCGGLWGRMLVFLRFKNIDVPMHKI